MREREGGGEKCEKGGREVNRQAGKEGGRAREGGRLFSPPAKRFDVSSGPGKYACWPE